MYHSPFNALIGNSAESGQNLKYSGTLDDVLLDIATLSSRQTIPSISASAWALHPPRIIRAVVDYKIQHPNSAEIEILLREAIGVALGVYSDPTNSAKSVGELRDKIKTMGLEALLTSPLNQPSDSVTWNATHPARSQGTAQQLASQTQSNDILFIALAHGGIAAGMDVYLRYCDASGSKDSAFYVARLSTQKLKDTQPRLSRREINYLRELAKGRQVVVFDEDRASGTTINIAHAYFSAQVFPNQDVMTLSNLDMRGELVKLGFGKKLAEIDEYIGSDKHLLIKKLYGEKIYNNKNIIDYKLKGDGYNNHNYIIKKPLNYEPFYSDKIHFDKPKIPTQITPEEVYGQLAHLFPDANPELLLALMPTKKHPKKSPYSLLEPLK